MNCQEFKEKWPHIDEATLTHASACADCLHWVESLAGEEEVLYMKDVPQPSSQLEERIMRAIYQTASHPTVPPLPALDHEAGLPGRTWKQKLFRRTYAWAGAAGFILAVGVWGILAVDQNRGAPQHNSQADAGSTAMQFSAREIAPVSPVPEGGHDSVQNGTAADHAVTFASPPETPVSASADIAAVQPPNTLMSQPANRSSGTRSQSPDARKLSKPAQKDAKASPGAPDQQQNANSALPQTGQAKSAEAEQQEVAATANDTPSIAQVPQEIAAAPQPPGTGQVALNGAEKQEITVSSFKDAQSAALVSDLPVPEAKVLPQGFVLHSLSLRYASETSPVVTHISAVYQRESDGVISLEVERNDQGQRSLSIPGTFARREVFAVDGRQAIGVTYHSATGMPAEHAVHVILEKDGIPLYVTATARGVSLTELMEVVQQLDWKKS